MDYVLRNRIGYFTKKSEKSKTLKLFYFFIGNNFDLYYAKKVVLFEKAFSLSKSINDLVAFLSKKTKMRRIKRLELGEIKSYSQMESMPNLNRLYFEMRLPKVSCSSFTEAYKKQTGTLDVFFISAFYDENIGVLHGFIKDYRKIAKDLVQSGEEKLPRKSQKDETFFFQTYFYSSPSQTPKELESGIKEMKRKIKLLQQNKREKSEQKEKVTEIEGREKEEPTHEGKNGGIKQMSESEKTPPKKEKLGRKEAGDNEGVCGIIQATNEENPTLKDQNTTKSGKESLKHTGEQLIRLPNNSLYSGGTTEGLTHGKGKEFLADGSSYVGEFRFGKWHGKGYIVNSDLEMSYGEFMDGELVGI